MDAWRTIDDRLHAWFDGPSHATGAALLSRIVDVAGRVVDVDVRATGVRVRLDREDAGLAPVIDATADHLGLSPVPARLQTLTIAIESPVPDRVAPFWALALGHELHGDLLTDPWRRDPPVRLVRDGERRPQRDRIHVDVVRPAAAITALTEAVGPAGGPYGLRLADPDGIEVDAVPGDRLEGADDWWTLFAAQARYAVPAVADLVALVEGAALAADEAGERLGIDVRSGSVTFDGGKDAWERDGEARPAFVALAAQIQAMARSLRAESCPAGLRLVQLGVDAVDVPAARAFWRALLAAEHDPREDLTDLVDPLGLRPVLFVQPMEASEQERRAQRPRVLVEVHVPKDAMRDRVGAVVAAGGRVLEHGDDRTVVGDGDGQVAVVVAE